MIAILAASLTASGLIGFFVVLIGLQVLYLLIWAKNAGSLPGQPPSVNAYGAKRVARF
jgi:hypothetical protein